VRANQQMSLLSRLLGPLSIALISRPHLPTSLATRLSGVQRAVAMSTAIPDVSAYMTAAPAPETKDYIMQQTMVRVKDPVKSLDFYTKVGA
jgi:hypothetical protein